MADTDLNRNTPGDGGNTFPVLGKTQRVWLGAVSAAAGSAPSASPGKTRTALLARITPGGGDTYVLPCWSSEVPELVALKLVASLDTGFI